MKKKKIDMYSRMYKSVSSDFELAISLFLHINVRILLFSEIL